MAVGDVKSGISSISAGEYLDIRPPSGEEWVIHNIYHQDDVEVYFTDGTNSIKIITRKDNGVIPFTCFHVTNSYWIKVKNSTSSSALIGYDGVQTK